MSIYSINRTFVAILTRLSILGVVLVFITMALNWSLQYWYLPYNLILAWVPLIIALLLVTKRFSPFVQLILLATWLAFLPNAYYLVTDIIHITEELRVSYSLDTVALFAVIAPGVAAGAYSLLLIDQCYFKKFSYSLRLAILGGIGLLVSVGVYLGRTLRWNSWDLVLHPFDVIKSFADTFTHSWLLTRFLADVIAFLVLIVVCHALFVHYGTRTKPTKEVS